MAIAVMVSLLWLAGAAALLFTLGSGGVQWLAVAVAIALPLVVIWFAALLARQSALIHDQAERLAHAAEELREAAASPRESRQASPPAPTPQRPEPAPPASQPPPVRLTQPVRPAPRAQPSQPQPVPADPRRQQSLPLGMAAEEAPVSLSLLVRALDFPSDPEDREGFRALRLALRDPKARRLVQASQDILTLLSQEGIYMDDLPPARARPELWRRFAEGERGPEVGKVGGIRDRSSLALTAARLREDPVFRDAAHHFLRLFDRTLTEIAPEATDTQLAALADTRTARAFMLVGRVTGIFE